MNKEVTPMKSVVEETYRLTDEGLNRLIEHLRVQERNFIPEYGDWQDGATLAPTLVERGFIIPNTSPEIERMAGILLTGMGLSLFTTLEKLRENNPPAQWKIEDCPDLLVWLSENGMVKSTSIMLPTIRYAASKSGKMPKPAKAKAKEKERPNNDRRYYAGVILKKHKAYLTRLMADLRTLEKVNFPIPNTGNFTYEMMVELEELYELNGGEKDLQESIKILDEGIQFLRGYLDGEKAQKVKGK